MYLNVYWNIRVLFDAPKVYETLWQPFCQKFKTLWRPQYQSNSIPIYGKEFYKYNYKYNYVYKYNYKYNHKYNYEYKYNYTYNYKYNYEYKYNCSITFLTSRTHIPTVQ